MEGSCENQRDIENRELSAGIAKGTDRQRGLGFEPPQYVMTGLSLKASAGPGRTTNCFQVSLPQGSRIQRGSQRTLLGAWRMCLLIVASEATDSSVPGW
jgi:hypothetical protein